MLPALGSARRRSAAALLLALTLASGCTPGDGPARPELPADAPAVDRMARDLGSDVVTLLWRGYHPETSSDVALVPKPFNVPVRWSGVGLGSESADPKTSHSTPWGYHSRVPILWYGPPWIHGGVRSDRPVDVTDMAPTLAELLGIPFDAQGEPLREALAEEPRAPDVIVVLAYDGGGWNVLERWPDAWPVLRRLMERGSLYTNATIGSAPAVTPAIHANIGTGVYPRSHRVSQITARLPDGSVGDVFFDEAFDPRLLDAPTLADEWDAANGNRPWTGMVAWESWHVGMLGRGTQVPGGDRDIAVWWALEPGVGEFVTNERLYALPGYLPDEGALRRRLRELDGSDGARDGAWRGHDLSDPRVVSASPAYVHHVGDSIVEVLRREPTGHDDLTDLLFLELKAIDLGGHIWNMTSPEEEPVLRAHDEVLARLVDTLDREVGRGRWVLGITADHGQTPVPETSGGLRIHPDLVGRAVERFAGPGVVERVTPDGMFVDRAALEGTGRTLEDVARYVATLRFGELLPSDADRDAIPPEDLRERVFAAALPSTYLASLTEDRLASLGPGVYPEGNLTRPVSVPA